MATMTAELETSDEVEVIAGPGPATLADFLEGLGDVDPSRILWTPRPGTATEADLVACGSKLVELIDGTLVSKTMGKREGNFALTLGAILWLWNKRVNAGELSGADGSYRIASGLVRLPDISFTAWSSLPNPTAHLQSVADYPPDLAVEILSESDRPAALQRKIQEYFSHGTKRVWVVDPRAGTVAVFTDESNSTTLSRNDSLDGGDVLPGFTLPLAELFDDPQLNPRPPLSA